MRFETNVIFIKVEKTYDRITGDYSMEETDRTIRLADVTDTGMERQQLLYGTVGNQAITIRLKTPVQLDYDYLIVNGIKYTVRKLVTYRGRQTIEAVVLKWK